MRKGTDPPRLARRLLELALPSDAREDICGDLEEVFRRHLASHGVSRARLWYLREAVQFARRFGWERVRDRAARIARRRDGEEPSSLRPTLLRRLAASGPSWLDFKLGFRMLIKQPGLTVVGGLAMAVAMGTGAAWFDLMNGFFHPTLPLDEGDRIVGIKNWDAAAGAAELRSLHDFVQWREDAKSVVDVSAFARFERNLITADGQARLVEGAAMTASAFRLVRVPPLLGRPLVDTDERESAAPVVVLGSDVWHDRFAGDPEVIGRVVKLGATAHTVVGVMPEGFTFPVRHDL